MRNPKLNRLIDYINSTTLKSKIFLSLFLLITCGFILPAQDFTIKDFNVELYLSKDGKINVSESIAVDFSKKKRGIFRTIPYKYRIDNKHYTTDIDRIEVKGNKSKVTRSGGKIKIRIGDKDVFVTDDQKYEINYRVSDAIIAYEDYEEVYWNITGNNWPTSIEHVGFVINLPKDITLTAEDVKVFTGKYKDPSSKARINQVSNTQIEGTNISPLKSGEGVTVAIKFPPGYFQDLPSFADKVKIIRQPGILDGAIPAGLFAIFLLLWNKMRHRSYPKYEVVEKYHPPQGLTSAHVGTYIDGKAHKRDVVSLIPYWASEGLLTIEKKEENTILTKLNEVPNDYPDYEKTFFNKIFEKSDIAIVEDFKNKFYRSFSAVQSSLQKEIKSFNYYDELYMKWFKSKNIVVFFIVPFILGMIALIGLKWYLLGILLIFMAFAILLFAIPRAPFSEYGYEVHQHLLGLQAFLTNPDEEKISELLDSDPKYFERMLPFAVAFGLDQSWIKSFENKFERAPDWFIYSGAPGVTTFSHFSEAVEFKSITSAFSSYPASSGTSSGSSGGGFSGGGFGGGGGGSW